MSAIATASCGADARSLLPLLYVAGIRRNDDALTVLVDGIDLGSVSMTAVRLG